MKYKYLRGYLLFVFISVFIFKFVFLQNVLPAFLVLIWGKTQIFMPTKIKLFTVSYILKCHSNWMIFDIKIEIGLMTCF